MDTPRRASARAALRSRAAPLSVSGRLPSSGHASPRASATPWRIRYSSKNGEAMLRARLAGGSATSRRRDLQPVHSIAHRAHGCLMAHEPGMKAPAVVLERHDEYVDVAPQRDVGRIGRCLDLTSAVDEDLHIVQPAEDVLAALEGSNIVPGMRAGGFHGNFERVSQFLERDTNGMQPLREIERAGLERRVFQQGRTMRQPRLDSPAPAARRLLVVTQISRDLAELVRDAAQFAGWQLGEQAISGACPGFRDGHRETRQRGRIVPAAFVQFLDQRREDIEFADNAQPLGDFPEPPPKTPRDSRIQLEYRQNFPEATRRDARTVECAHVSFGETV